MNYLYLYRIKIIKKKTVGVNKGSYISSRIKNAVSNYLLRMETRKVIKIHVSIRSK